MNKREIKKWVMGDGIVKRGNKVSIERAIDLTLEKAEQERNKLIKDEIKFLAELGHTVLVKCFDGCPYCERLEALKSKTEEVKE